MPELQTYLEVNDPLTIIYRSTLKPRSDSLPVINNIITLLEIPSEIQKVAIAGLTEVSQEMYRKKASLEENEFLVDYTNGVVMFHPSQDGRTYLCSYMGRGLILYPASRIYAMTSRNPDIVVTLQDYIDDVGNQLLVYNQKILEINNAITNTVSATINANKATDNAILATQNADVATKKALDAAATSIDIRKPPVDSYDDLALVYPNPENGWKVVVNSTGNVYRFDGVTLKDWELVGNMIGGSIPFATEETDGLIHKEDYRNFVVRTITFAIPKILYDGVQNYLIQFPFDGEIEQAYAYCLEGGTSSVNEIGLEQISSIGFDNNGTWQSVFNQNIFIQPFETKGSAPVIRSTAVTKGDYFRLNVLQLDSSLKGLTLQINIKTNIIQTEE